MKTPESVPRTRAWTVGAAALGLLVSLSAASFTAFAHAPQPPAEPDPQLRALNIVSDAEGTLSLATADAASAGFADYHIEYEGVFGYCCEPAKDQAGSDGAADYQLDALDAYTGQLGVQWEYWEHVSLDQDETRPVGFVSGYLTVGCSTFVTEAIPLIGSFGDQDLPLVFQAPVPEEEAEGGDGGEDPEDAGASACDASEVWTHDVTLTLLFEMAWPEDFLAYTLGSGLDIHLDTYGRSFVTVREMPPPPPVEVVDEEVVVDIEADDEVVEDGDEIVDEVEEDTEGYGGEETYVLPAPSMVLVVGGILGLVALLNRRRV